MKTTIHLLLLLLSINTSFSQTQAEKNFGSWYMFHANHKIAEKWSINTGLQERNYQTFQNYNLFLVYVGANYKINNNVSVNLTYGYLDIDRTFDPDVTPNTIEHRIFEQITLKDNFFKLPFSHRFRLEHRNLYSMGKYNLINRFRYRLKSTIPINKKVYGTLSNEWFFNFKGDFYAENRFMVTLGYKISKNLAIEAGYLNQFINKQYLDRLLVGIHLKTDVRKKTKTKF